MHHRCPSPAMEVKRGQFSKERPLDSGSIENGAVSINLLASVSKIKWWVPP